MTRSSRTGTYPSALGRNAEARALEHRAMGVLAREWLSGLAVTVEELRK